MGKKKEKQKHDLADESNTESDLKSLIHHHSLFFDKLIELIPPKFYLPTDGNEVWFSGLSKAKKASAKKQTIENIKKARRERLDPEKSSATTLDLLMQNLKKEKTNDESDDEEADPKMSGLEDDERSVTYEELRQRLHHKIEELRAGRNSSGSDKVKKKNERYKKNGIVQKKRKRGSGSEEKKSASSERLEKDVAEATKGLTFGHVKVGDEDLHRKKKTKLSKLQELEKAKELAEAKKDPEKGSLISEKHSWKTATNRAAGIKVHDDPKRMKQSIQKEMKRRQKNAGKWKERVETQQKLKAGKQQKRSQNIADRVQQKRMRKIAKREKKLMRPGFEGRKEGYINDSSS